MAGTGSHLGKEWEAFVLSSCGEVQTMDRITVQEGLLPDSIREIEQGKAEKIRFRAIPIVKGVLLYCLPRIDESHRLRNRVYFVQESHVQFPKGLDSSHVWRGP